MKLLKMTESSRQVALTFAPIAASVGQLHQFGIDLLVGLSEDINQIFSLLGVAGREEGVGCTSVLSASCAPDAVDVVLRAVRVVEVDDKLDVTHICKALWFCRAPHKLLQCVYVFFIGRNNHNRRGTNRKHDISERFRGAVLTHPLSTKHTANRVEIVRR